MDFNNVFALNEAEDAANTTSTTTQDMGAQASVDPGVPKSLQVSVPDKQTGIDRNTLYVANANLKKIIADFGRDPRIQQMERRYDGPTPTTSRGTFGHYKNKFSKAVSKVGKIVIITCIIIAVVACGVGIAAAKGAFKMAASTGNAGLGGLGGAGGAGADALGASTDTVPTDTVPTDGAIPTDGTSTVPNGAVPTDGTPVEAPATSAEATPTSEVPTTNTTEPVANEVPNSVEPSPNATSGAGAVVPNQTPGPDLSTWQGRVKAGKASDADMEQAYNAYKNGTYNPGPKTLAYFNQTHPATDGITDVANSAEVAAAGGAKVDTTTAVNTTNSDAGFQRWKAKNQKNYNSIAAQAQAVGKDPDEVAHAMYNQGNASTDVNAFNAAERANGLADASGSGRTNRGAMKAMRKANVGAYNAQQLDSMVQSDPELNKFVQLYKSQHPEAANLSNEDIINKAKWNSGLYKTVTHDTEHGRASQRVLPPENKGMYDALQRAEKVLKNKNVPQA